MGNMRSLPPNEEPEDIWWSYNRNTNYDSGAKTSASQDLLRLNSNDTETSSRELSEEHKEKLNEFKLELARKHEKRRQIIAEKRKEMDDLREEVIKLRKENQQLKEGSAAVKSDCCSDESALHIERLRKENEGLKFVLEEKSKLLESSESRAVFDFEKERKDYQAHVVALKDVISVSKHMLQIRETQLRELKQKIDSIEESLADREMNVLSQDLRSEYERQLQSIRNLRTLYEERQRVEKREKDELVSQLDSAKRDLQEEQNKVSELEQRNTRLEEDNSKKYDEIKMLESNLGLTKAESRQYQAELTVINQLFSEILLGFNNSQDIDLDKLQKHLEDHRNLLQDIVVNEISSEVSYALPKVLLDLLNQLSIEEETKETGDDTKDVGKLETIKEESESQSSTIYQMNSAEEIVENLPKVWRVLIELLSHQKAPTNNLTDDEEDENPCYKTVQTPKGPSLVLSVSQTFIRLKDLILEKKSLEKETSHLKQLNGHLENRLQDQEKRLELVQMELSKTWHVVGKLQKQHQMLHTQEKILRYELAQKRKLLTELKEELEYSREKWAQAREKNSSTEQQWRQLRTEFASRRNTITNDDLNNSVESGYSDDRESSSSDEEPGYETDISECAQKVSNGDHIEVLSVVKENQEITDEGSVLNLNQNQLDEVVFPDQNEEASGSSCSTKEVVHSDVEQLKTDLVQNIDNVEKTVECTNLQASEAELVATNIESGNSEQPSVSHDVSSVRSLEETLARRDRRLKRLEGQAEQLVTKVTNTANRSVAISNRLDNLHEVYGQNLDDLQQPVNLSNSNEEVALNAPREEILNNIVLDENNEVPSINVDVDVSSIHSNEDNQE
ncbi:hypothetical protein NQ314_011097 [Rhamnusium bicolor]|uniref:Uncharacterized protein n=1 Tax=Rhamnusium bicolor TaxID=1586634 RepID=A0AAV8XM34_9CUCU|nr:hypothetical protein NQ314_011097 [Rhamnusium bicolor]